MGTKRTRSYASSSSRAPVCSMCFPSRPAKHTQVTVGCSGNRCSSNPPEYPHLEGGCAWNYSSHHIALDTLGVHVAPVWLRYAQHLICILDALDSFLLCFRALCSTASVGTARVSTWLTMPKVQVYIPFSDVSQPHYCCLHARFYLSS